MQTGLIFASGGGLGAYDVGVLKRIYKLEPNFIPYVVTGISMGAIQAALLAGGKDNNPLETLETFWNRLSRPSFPFLPKRLNNSLSLIGNPNFYWMRMDYFTVPFWTNFYYTGLFRQLLEDLIDLDKLNNSSIQVIIPSVDIETATIQYFVNQGSDKTSITIDHLMANASLPIPFPMTKIQDRFYWDGGYFDHTPFSRLIQEFTSDHNIRKRLIVSSLYPKYDTLPITMIDVYLRMVRIIVVNKIETNIRLINEMNDIVQLIERLDQELPAKNEIRKLPQFKNFLNYPFIHTINYISNTDTKLCSGTLTRQNIQQRMNAGYRDAGHVFA